MKTRLILTAAVAWCITLATVEFNEEWLYQLSRWAIFGVTAWRSFTLWKADWKKASVLPALVAIAFNPFDPINFGSDWAWADWIAAILLTVSVPDLADWKDWWGRKGRPVAVKSLKVIVSLGICVAGIWGGWMYGKSRELTVAKEALETYQIRPLFPEKDSAELRKWRREATHEIDCIMLDYKNWKERTGYQPLSDKYEMDLMEETVVSAYLSIASCSELPKTSDPRFRELRETYAQRFFGGKGAKSNKDFYNEIKMEAQKRNPYGPYKSIMDRSVPVSWIRG